MRWLGILTIVIVGAVIYLRSMLSDGATVPDSAPVAPATSPARVEPEHAPVRSPVVVRTPKPIPIHPRVAPEPTKPIDRVVTTTTPAPAMPDKPAKPEDEPPWTEQQRWQQLWTASGRYEKGNYPGAVEAAMELALRYPPWKEDGWKVAIEAHCAMNEPDNAKALFAKMTDQPAIKELLKVCGEWNIDLTK